MIVGILKLLHFIGIAFGLGGATIASIISIKAEKDIELGKQAMKIISSISKLIWLGLILLIISGIGLSYFVNPDDKLLIIKHVLVFWLVVFGIIITFKASKLKKLANEKPSLDFFRIKKQVRLLSIINLILWYLIVILSAFL